MLSRYHPTLSEIDNKILRFCRNYPSRIQSSNYTRAVVKTSKDFRIPSKVKVRHVNDVIRHYPHPDRSPGLPYTSQGIRRKADVDTNIIRWNVHKMKYGTIKKFRTPCTIAVKTVLSPPEKKKFRCVWVYPVDMTMAEGMFAQPLINAYNSLTFRPYALWFRWHKRHMHKLNSILTPGTRWLGLDYSSFDESVPPWLIRDAFSILREQLDFSQYEFYGLPTDSDSLPRLWDCIIDYFINTPARMKSGKIQVFHGGVPSGSYFTNLVDSICNSIMTNYLLLELGVQYYETFFMGDDGLIRFAGDLDLDLLCVVAKERFGCTINPDKSEIGRYVHWLGYRLSDSRPVPDLQKLMSQLFVPSKPDRYSHDILIRARALWICSFNYGPFRDFLLEHGLLRDLYRVYKDDAIERLEYLGLDISSSDAYMYC